jgi:hypothetical protein
MPVKLKKGSMEAKNFMAKLRAMKGPNKKSKARGEGIMNDAWDYVKKGASYIKDNKLLSKGLSAASLISSPEYKPLLTSASGLASAIGLGKKPKKSKLMIT